MTHIFKASFQILSNCASSFRAVVRSSTTTSIKSTAFDRSAELDCSMVDRDCDLPKTSHITCSVTTKTASMADHKVRASSARCALHSFANSVSKEIMAAKRSRTALHATYRHYHRVSESFCNSQTRSLLNNSRWISTHPACTYDPLTNTYSFAIKWH